MRPSIKLLGNQSARTPTHERRDSRTTTKFVELDARGRLGTRLQQKARPTGATGAQIDSNRTCIYLSKVLVLRPMSTRKAPNPLPSPYCGNDLIHWLESRYGVTVRWVVDHDVSIPGCPSIFV